MAPQAINSLSDAVTAAKRLDEFFAHEEIQEAKRYPLPTNSDVTISIVSIFQNFLVSLFFVTVFIFIVRKKIRKMPHLNGTSKEKRVNSA